MDEKLLKLLHDEQVITEAQYQRALQESEQTGARFDAILEQQGILREEQVLECLSKKFRLPLTNWDEYVPDRDTLELVPEHVAGKYTAFPFAIERGKRQNKLTLALADPTNVSAIDDISFMTGCVVKAEVASTRAIQDAIRMYYQGEGLPAAETISGTAGGQGPQEDFLPCGVEELDALMPLLSASSEVSNEEFDGLAGLDRENPASAFLLELLTLARERGVSEIHIEPDTHEEYHVQLCFQGVLQSHTRIPESLGSDIVTRLRKILQRAEQSAGRKYTDAWRGGFQTFAIGGTLLSLFVSLYPTPFGERVLLKIRDSETIPDIAELGIEESALKTLNRILAKPQGLLLLISPPRQGKTTTMYGLLNRFRQPDMQVFSLERSIETYLEEVRQIPMSSTLSVQEWLALISFNAPDLVVLDDIHDPVMAQLALELASSTLVFGCLTATDAAEGMSTFFSHIFYPDEVPSQAQMCYILDSMNGVVSQHLIRTLCTHCKEPVPTSQADIELMQSLTAASHTAPQMFSLYKGKGCHECANTGYKAQTGVFEVIKFDKHFKQFFLQTPLASSFQLRRFLEQLPFTSLEQQSLRMLRENMTSTEELRRVFHRR